MRLLISVFTYLKHGSLMAVVRFSSYLFGRLVTKTCCFKTETNYNLKKSVTLSVPAGVFVQGSVAV